MPQRIRQAAALAVKDGLICLITTRTQRRWVLPKGHIEEGHAPHTAAEAEAWEEAGLKGVADPEPLGIYRYRKNDRRFIVHVFRLAAAVQHELWPERLVRKRQWVTLEDAVRLVKPKGLKAILKALAAEPRSERIVIES